MSAHHSKISKQMHSPLKTVPGMIGDRYQMYCTVYKIHGITTHHGGAVHSIDKDINLHVEEAETTGIYNDNESISGIDTTVALGGPEAEGNSDELTPSNQAKLTAITGEINDLHQ